MNKADLRKSGLERRRAIGAADRELFSNNICCAIINSEQFKKAGTIMAYMAFKDEVSLQLLINECLLSGKQLALPKVNKQSGTMKACFVKDLNDLECGAYGIMEPQAGAPECSPDKLDLILVPILAFDENCNRLGWGAGYYDRFLPLCTKAALWGVAFAQQQADNVLPASHDAVLDRVITQDKTFILKNR